MAPENKNELKNILKQKINELGNYLMDNCENETKKKEIHDSLNDLPLYKLYMFICFIDENKINNHINEFIKIYNLNDTFELREKLKDYLKYFIEIKNILKS